MTRIVKVVVITAMQHGTNKAGAEFQVHNALAGQPSHTRCHTTCQPEQGSHKAMSCDNQLSNKVVHTCLNMRTTCYHTNVG